MVSVRDIQIIVFSLITLFSLFLTAVFRRASYIDGLLVEMPWLESFNIPWASSVYGLVALCSIVIVVFIQQTKQ